MQTNDTFQWTDALVREYASYLSDKRISWANALINIGREYAPVPEDIIFEQFKQSKQKLVIFTTEDGVPVYKGDGYWVLNTDRKTLTRSYTEKELNKPPMEAPYLKYFHTFEAASEYRALHKPILFTTYDNVEIRKGDTYWYVVISDSPALIEVGRVWKSLMDIANWDDSRPPLGAVQFSTYEAANDYVLMNKPCLSITDIQSVMTDMPEHFSYNREIEKFKKIAQSKIQP